MCHCLTEYEKDIGGKFAAMSGLLSQELTIERTAGQLSLNFSAMLLKSQA
jgi:hypothetical protein